MSLPRQCLPASLYPLIDARLKEFKQCRKHAHENLSSFFEELQLLNRLCYKIKNQHRAADFWRSVIEMRRYARRVEDLEISAIIDLVYHSFFAEGAGST
jgi:hypothetical protein